MTRAEWLASLKVGDSVGIRPERADRYPGTSVVTKITPGGRIHAGGYVFSADGKVYPRADYLQDRRLVPDDDTHRAEVKRATEMAEFTKLAERIGEHRYIAPFGFDFTTHNAALQAVLDALRSKP